MLANSGFIVIIKCVEVFDSANALQRERALRLGAFGVSKDSSQGNGVGLGLYDSTSEEDYGIT